MKAYQVLVRYALVAALVGLGADQPALAQGRTPAQPTSRPSAPSGELIIYEDALAEGWQNWSWNTQVDFANAQPALGRRSAAVTYRGPYSGFSLRAPAPIDAQRYSGIAFWVHGGSAGTRSLSFYVQQSDSGDESRKVQLEAPAGTWTPITISLSALGNPKVIKRLNLQDNSARQQPTFYVDNVRLVSGRLEGALSIPPTGPTKEGDYIVYSDVLAEGWENWSWDTQVDLANAQPALDRRSAAVVYKKPLAGFSLRAPAPIDAQRYTGIAFWVHGGSTGKRSLSFCIQQSDSGDISRKVYFEVPAGTWTPITIPLSLLDNPKVIKRLNLQDSSGKPQPMLYVDNIRLVSGPLKGAPSVPFITPTRAGN
jgi:hypothetical protein